jgi:cyclophilin family peptidyl-prolyl cis-trans isomerase
VSNEGVPYDVCLSFAGEDRPYVELVAAALRGAGIRVFYDAYEEASLWGKDLYQHLAGVYEQDGRYCVVFLSAAYASKVWPRHELKSAQARAFKDNREYLLPARFDDTRLPGVPETVAYIDLRSRTPQQLADIIIQKVRAGSNLAFDGQRPGPPAVRDVAMRWIRRSVIAFVGATLFGVVLWLAVPSWLNRETATSPAATSSDDVATAPVTDNVSNVNPANTADIADLRVDLRTTEGVIAVEFHADDAPNHVRHFINLVRKGFYNQTSFHRIIPNFMILGGDPNTALGDRSTWGKGGAEDLLKAEFNGRSHTRGTVSMARMRNLNSASSQFFICVADVPFLDRQYTVFGHVVSGMDVVDRIVKAPRNEQAQPLNPVTIQSAVVVYPSRRDEN